MLKKHKLTTVCQPCGKPLLAVCATSLRPVKSVICLLNIDKHKDINAEVSIGNPVIDVCKYGFTISENKDGIVSYEKRVADIIICLYDCSGMFSLYYWQGEHKTYVANRYIVENQEQFDFLINNGRLGWVFNATPM